MFTVDAVQSSGIFQFREKERCCFVSLCLFCLCPSVCPSFILFYFILFFFSLLCVACFSSISTSAVYSAKTSSGTRLMLVAEVAVGDCLVSFKHLGSFVCWKLHGCQVGNSLSELFSFKSRLFMNGMQINHVLRADIIIIRLKKTKYRT